MVLVGIASLALALGPSVAVDVSTDEAATASGQATARALRGWLVQRLIEEGFTIAPPDQADRVVTLEVDGDAIAVHSQRDHFVIDSGPPAVMRLEVLHRTRMVLDHAEVEPLAEPPGRRAVLGFRSTTEAPEGAAGELESALLVEGYVLTPRPRPGDPVLCVVHAPQTLAVSVTRGDATCPDPQLAVSYDELRGPEGASDIVRLIESGTAPSRTSSAPVEAEVVSPTVAEPAEPAPKRRRWPSEDAEVRTGLDAGLVARGDVDGYVRSQTRIGRRIGPGAALHLSIIPSRDDGVRAVDTILAGGPDVRFGKKRFGVEFGLLVGTLMHAFQHSDARGGSAAWYVGIPASVSFGKPQGPRAHLFTEGFVTGGRLRHVRENAPAWARSAWGIRVGLGFTWGWKIR
ncbi:MAG: hypothetical protein AAGA54_11065 [Myxococcota bacterium]